MCADTVTPLQSNKSMFHIYCNHSTIELHIWWSYMFPLSADIHTTAVVWPQTVPPPVSFNQQVKKNADRSVPQVPHHPCWWHVDMIQFYTIKLNSADVTDYFASCVSMFLYFPSTPTLLVLNQAAHYMCNSDLWTPQRHSCSHNTHTLHTLLHWPYSDTCTGVLSIVNNSYLH